MNDESAATKWKRRAITIPMHVFALVVMTLFAPLWLSVTLFADVAARGKLALTRCGLFLVIFLAGEVFGVGMAFALWCLRPIAFRGHRFHDANFRLQCFWARTLFRSVQRLFDLQVDVDGSEVCAQGPLLLLMRHVSVGDTLFPAIFVSDRFGIRLRYVLKRELLWDPCLDIVGQRLTNVFVRRGESGLDADRVGALATNLGPRDGVLIFPEGTRFTERKREQLKEKLAARTSKDKTTEHETALLRAATDAMTRVLPPRLGGTLALLDRAPNVDVVLCAHTGFEGISTLRDLYTGSLVHRRVHVRFWRVPHQELPKERLERAEWLLREWERVNAFVVAHQLGDGASA